jgi:DNA repair exonuclease SbcCD ATPase subunit
MKEALFRIAALEAELAREKARRMIDPGAFDNVVMKLAAAERINEEVRRALAGGRQG